jgi:hypothetical protein
MAGKTKVTLTLDQDLVDLAKLQYPNFSGRVNDLLSIDLHGEDEESQLMKEIAKLSDTLEIKKDKLCNVRKKKALVQGSDSAIDSVLSWANVIYQRRGVIGLNILKRECKNRDVSFDNVKNILEKEGVAFVNYDGW